MSTEREGPAGRGDGLDSFVIDPRAEGTDRTPVNVTGQQEDKFFSQAGLEYQLRHRQQDLGVLGKFFGSSGSAATNIAGIVVCASLLFLVASLWITSPEIVEVRKLVISLIATALAFIFGAASKK